VPGKKVSQGAAAAIGSVIVGSLTSITLAFFEGGPSLAFTRFVLGALIFSLVWKKLKELNLGVWVASLMQSMSILFFFLAISTTDVAIVVAISAVAPFVTAVIERYMRGIFLTREGKAAVALSVTGAVAASLLTADTGISDTGVIFAVLSMLLAALADIFQSSFGGKYSLWVRTEAINITGIAVTLPLIFFTGFTLNPGVITGGLVAAVGGGGLGVVLFLQSLRTLPVSLALTLMSLGLPLVALAGAVFLGQSSNIGQLAAYTMIVAASIMVATRGLTVAGTSEKK
jgi:probable blue pigment (indigoidine) exporter